MEFLSQDVKPGRNVNKRLSFSTFVSNGHTVLKNDKCKKPKTICKLRNTSIFINEDFCFETMEYRKQLWQEVKSL